MSEATNKWNRPAQPPPPLFLGKKERDLVKQVNDELIERVIGQQILYYPISLSHTNFHPVYGEALDKVFLPPIQVYVLVDWENYKTVTGGQGIDRTSEITVHFHKRRINEDQNLAVTEGDFILYGDLYYEIVTTEEPRQLFGQVGHRIEVSAKCVRARDGVFNGQ